MKFILPLAALALSCCSLAHATELIEVARSPEKIWNGVAVSSTGRIFVSFPSLQEGPSDHVAEIGRDGSITPYPGGTWNDPTPDTPSRNHFIGVNAVVTDPHHHLWVVDPAGRFGSKPLPGEAKLVKIDLTTNQVRRVYAFPTDVLPEGGFINDVRLTGSHAILTDSGLGALLIVDLDSGRIRRVLSDDPRLKADPQHRLTINGKPYLNAQGKTPQMHVNTLDIDPDGRFLYFQPNGGPRLLRIPVPLLCDPHTDDATLAAAIEDQGPTRFNAGMTFGPDGSLYYSDIEISGITRRTPDGTFETIVSDPELIAWPDASRIGPDGDLYFPAAQIHRLPGNQPDGKSRLQPPFRLFKVALPRP
ncbi:sugar lactone lactonase YvrE [Haloferula luteola]|uniref:Sugar lactone lactonase YvrE n=1 Tax=Haloferula luteola TaxID=595692 RepID=A0A840UWS3_9BACT|nr:L-dopachrome tautomerase-related protein [Haloferula luteola]MBB5350175.1 sugar lactone lactonase YvrE [Haloferula luteola]